MVVETVLISMTMGEYCQIREILIKIDVYTIINIETK